MSEFPSEGEWLHRLDCPACKYSGKTVARLFSQRFYLGTARAPDPPGPVMLMRCTGCGLVYKNLVPSPQLLQQITSEVSDELWIGEYDFADELVAIRQVDPRALTDVIDVGAAGGKFLDTLPQGSRRSAMDIVRFEDLRIDGEFIEGFLDQPELSWSGHAFTLIALFDVAEHLYDPDQAFANLRRLTRPGGLVILETGDNETVSDKDLGSWYYLNMFEHHIAWNQSSLERMAARHGFEMVSTLRKRHKLNGNPRWQHRLKIVAFDLFPNLSAALYRTLGKPFHVPQRFVDDHIRMILRAPRE